MIKQSRALLASALILMACGCASTSHRLSPATRNPSTAAEFRSIFPIDKELLSSALEDYAKVQVALLSASSNGAKAYVSLLTANGQIHLGYDEFFSGKNPRTRETRDNYSAVQVGDVLCAQGIDEDVVSCKKTDSLHLGPNEILSDHVARVWMKDINCIEPEKPCRFIKFQTTASESDDNSNQGYSREPELVGHDYELAFDASNYLPIYFKQTDHYHVGVTATAFYRYQFGEAIEQITLPNEHASIR